MTLTNWRSSDTFRRTLRNGKVALHDVRACNLRDGARTGSTTAKPQGHFGALANLGVNTVRLATRWEHVQAAITHVGEGLTLPVDLTVPRLVCQRAASAGLKVILNLHHQGYPGSMPTVAWATATAYDVDDYVEQAGAIYRCITGHTSAASFATDSAKWDALTMLEFVRAESGGAIAALARLAVNEPNVIGLGLGNEVSNGPLDTAIVDLYADLSQVARRAGWWGICLGMVTTGQNLNTGSWSAFTDLHPRNVLQIHDYYLGLHAGDGSFGFGTNLYADNGTYGDDGATDYPAAATYAQVLGHLRRYYAMPGVDRKRVWVGEWGMGLDLAGASRYVRHMRAAFLELGLGHAWWVDSDGAGILMAIFRSSGYTNPHKLAGAIFAP